MSLHSLILIVAGGAVAGAFGVLLGLGGGVFLIPFLVLVLGVPMHQAIATSIIAVIATSSVGAVMNLERQTVNIRLGIMLETTTVVGAILGGVTASALSGIVLMKIFGILLLLVATLMVWRPRPGGGVASTRGVFSASYLDEAEGKRISYSVRNVPATMGISFVAGNLSGLLGIGGGIFKVPAMTLLSGVPLKAATATSNFMIGVTAAAGAYVYFDHGYVDPLLVSPAVVGVLGGAALGATLTRRVTSRVLNLLFAAVLLIASFQLLVRSWQ